MYMFDIMKQDRVKEFDVITMTQTTYRKKFSHCQVAAFTYTI